MTPEVRVLVHPAETFRTLAAEQAVGAWRMMRRPLLLLFVFGCVVSLQASNRLSARLILDGIISFAFIPFFEVLSLAIVYRRAPRRVPLARAVDAFFVANAPWLVWLLLFVVVRSVQTPVQATAGPVWWQVTALLSLLPIVAWSLYIDLQFFRSIRAQGRGAAAGDLARQRLISWTCIVAYFIGHDGTTFFQLFTGWLNV